MRIVMNPVETKADVQRSLVPAFLDVQFDKMMHTAHSGDECAHYSSDADVMVTSAKS